jgi:hypothetical protein
MDGSNCQAVELALFAWAAGGTFRQTAPGLAGSFEEEAPASVGAGRDSGLNAISNPIIVQVARNRRDMMHLHALSIHLIPEVGLLISPA